MIVAKQIHKILQYYRQVSVTAITALETLAQIESFFLLFFFKSKQIYKHLKTISNVWFKNPGHMKL